MPWLLAMTAAALALMAGCESSGPRSSVEGRVNYAGEPVDEGGGIAFLPTEDGASAAPVRATGEILNGRYRLDSRRGPTPGKYRVEITWQKRTGKKVPGEAGHPKDETEQVIPPQYNEESKLTVVVQPGRNTIDFDLK
jgi:hypothetical protein